MKEQCLGCYKCEGCTMSDDIIDDLQCRCYESHGFVPLTKKVLDALVDNKQYLLRSPSGLVIGAYVNKWDDDVYFTNDWYDEIETEVTFDGEWEITFIPN